MSVHKPQPKYGWNGQVTPKDPNGLTIGSRVRHYLISTLVGTIVDKLDSTDPGYPSGLDPTTIVWWVDFDDGEHRCRQADYTLVPE